MKRKLKILTGLISASLSGSYANADNAVIISNNNTKDDSDTFRASVLNESVPLRLAAHRSHSSHSSHRSSSGGRSRRPSSPPADPLGQSPRPSGSYPQNAQPSSKSKSTSTLSKDDMANIIKRVQLMLQFEGYYEGTVDGIMGQNTRKAITSYRKAKGLPVDKFIDEKLLNALGLAVN